MIAVNYTGSFTNYSGTGGLTGANNAVALDYSHVLSRRLTLNVTAVGSVLSQNYALDNANPGPETDSVANINLSSSPNIQITDSGTKQYSTQIDVTFQQSARLSFDGGVSYFGIVRDAAGLLGMTGEQGRGDMNYRLTRQMTVGAYYSYSYYIFPRGFGTTDTNTAGGIFSVCIYQYDAGAAAGRSILRGQPGISASDDTSGHRGASWTRFGAGRRIHQSGNGNSDISAQFVKDFRGGKTASVAYAHGVSPGNGVFQTSEQQSMSATFGMSLFRTYKLQVGAGRDSLTAVGVLTAELGNYSSEYGRVALSRSFSRGVALNFGVEFRHYLVSDSAILENQLRLTSGLTWGPPGGKLWPF